MLEPQPTQPNPDKSHKDNIELEVKRAIAGEIEAYRKSMESYSSNLEKAAENHAAHLQTSTRWIASGFILLAGAAVYVFYYFMGQSVETAKNQIPNTLRDVVPGLISQEVSKLAVITQANQEMRASIEAHRSQLVKEALEKLNAAATDMTRDTATSISNQVATLQSGAIADAKKAIDDEATQAKSGVIQSVNDSAKLLIEGELKNRVKAAMDSAVSGIEKLNASQRIALAEAVPVGTIVPFGGNTNAILNGWLLCDGSLRYRNTLSNLFDVIGTSWGSGDGSNTFNLPNLQGMFLRGVDPTGKNDPDYLKRFSPGGGNTNGVGSYQADELSRHSHVYEDGQPKNTGTEREARDNYSKGESDTVYSHDASRKTTQTGGSETRPKNAYVYYIIKY